MIIGYFAAYAGAEFPCTLMHSEHGTRIQIFSDTPLDGFTPAGGRYTLSVAPDMCDAVGLRRETATHGHYQVFVLAEDTTGVLIEYDGPNSPADPLAHLVERGVWRQTVQPADLRNRGFVSTLLAL